MHDGETRTDPLHAELSEQFYPLTRLADKSHSRGLDGDLTRRDLEVLNWLGEISFSIVGSFDRGGEPEIEAVLQRFSDAAEALSFVTMERLEAQD